MLLQTHVGKKYTVTCLFWIDPIRQQTFSIKGQIESIFHCMGHMVTVTTT